MALRYRRSTKRAGRGGRKRFMSVFGRKKSKSFKGKRKRFGKGNFARRVKNVVMKQMTTDSSWVTSYADYNFTSGTINTVAKQTMWSSNQVASGTYAAGTLTHLHMDDPQELKFICDSIDSLKTTRFTRKSTTKEVIITNTETAPIEIWEYRCMSRRDALIYPNVTLTEGFADGNIGAGGALPTEETIGATPFMNPRFVANYKILKVKKRRLQPAGIWRIKYSLKKPRAYSKESYAPNSIPKIIMRGQRFSLFVMHGSYASNSNATDTHDVGISSAAVGMVFKTSYHYSWLADKSGEQGFSTNLFGFTQGPGNPSYTGFVPHPIVTNHPESTIQPTTFVAGAASGTAGDRIWDSNAQSRYATFDEQTV